MTMSKNAAKLYVNSPLSQSYMPSDEFATVKVQHLLKALFKRKGPKPKINKTAANILAQSNKYIMAPVVALANSSDKHLPRNFNEQQHLIITWEASVIDNALILLYC